MVHALTLTVSTTTVLVRAYTLSQLISKKDKYLFSASEYARFFSIIKVPKKRLGIFLIKVK